MTDRTRPDDSKLSREERLAAKLRDNLRRRKTQARELIGGGTDQADKSPLPKLGGES